MQILTYNSNYSQNFLNIWNMYSKRAKEDWEKAIEKMVWERCLALL